MSDDKDRTESPFGAPPHGQQQGGGWQPLPPLQRNPPPAHGGDERTIIGGPLTPPGAGPGLRPAGPPGPGPAFGYPPQPPGHAAPSGGTTWVSGGPAGGPQPALRGPAPGGPSGWGQQPYPAAGPGFGGGIGEAASGGGGGGGASGSPFESASQIGRASGVDQGFFPQYAPAQTAMPRAATPRIPLHEALRVRDLGAGSSSNPLLAAAASLLILLGRLRTGLVELQVAPLMEHVTREIERFEHNARSAGVDPHEVLVAKYALSGAADDIVQNLPGSDRGSWQQYSMVARFFHKRDSGVGFFQEVEKALHAPAQRYNLLELMLVCLALGFEGQFRTQADGGVQLTRYRSAIYESLRRVRPRPDEDIAVMWQPVVQGGRRRFGALPLPAVAGAAAVALLAAFAVLSTLIGRDGSAVAAEMRALHQGAPVLQIDRSGIAYQPQQVDTQLDRMRAAFGPEIAAGQVQVEPKGDYIAVRIGNLQLFDSGAVEVREGFTALAARIAEVLNAEGGPIVIEGHTDNVPMSGRGALKDNYQLSEARAEAVAAVLVPLLTDGARVEIKGVGEDEPVGDNATDEGRTANRRVEILLAREGTYGAPASGDGTAAAAPPAGSAAPPAAAAAPQPTETAP